MKLVDEKGRLFGLINIFDLLVLMAVLFIIAAVGYKLAQNNASGQAKTQTKTWMATIKCSSVPDKFAEALKKDPRIFYENDGFVNAKITGMTVEDASILIPGLGGKMYESHDPSLKDVYVQIEIQDNASDNAVRVGRYTVYIGGKLTVKTIYAASYDGLVTDLYEK